MSGSDHLARARDYIAKGDEYYRLAGEEIVEAMNADPTLTQPVVAERIGKSLSWVERTLRALREGRAVDHQSGSNKRDDVARTVLSDPERRRQVIESLEPQEVEALAEQATQVAVDRARAKRAEHTTAPTASDLMGGERFDPAEFWADTLIIRVNRNARELASLRQRAGGLIFGTMPQDEAFGYLEEAERLIADARAEMQERVQEAVS